MADNNPSNTQNNQNNPPIMDDTRPPMQNMAAESEGLDAAEEAEEKKESVTDSMDPFKKPDPEDLKPKPGDTQVDAIYKMLNSFVEEGYQNTGEFLDKVFDKLIAGQPEIDTMGSEGQQANVQDVNNKLPNLNERNPAAPQARDQTAAADMEVEGPSGPSLD